MSDTPETDNFIVCAGYVRTDHQWRTFARKLERERNSLQDQRDLSICMAKERERERDEAFGALAAQDKKMEVAGKQCGIPFEVFGCDWPDRVAEELNAVANERNAARNSKLELQQERDEAREALRKLSQLVHRLFALLETVEVSDSEREFHPTVIRSCRVAHTSELAELLPALKEAAK